MIVAKSRCAAKRKKNSIPVGLCVCVVLLVLAVSCGKKGSPKPPEAIAPSPVKYFALRGTVDSVILTWQAPDEDASGNTLTDLAGFAVKRNDYVKDKRPDFEEIAEIPVAEVGEGEDADVLEPVEYSYTDTSVEPGKQYEYLVVPVNEDGVEGATTSVMRVTFVGESSVFESFQPR